MSSAVPTRKKRYHKRSSWACDECKLRKKKCDGEQPCAMCTLIGTECLYLSKHRPHRPPTQRVRELEEQARSFRDLLGRIKNEVSGSNLADVERTLASFEYNASDVSQGTNSPSVAAISSTIPLTSILNGRGRLLSSGRRSIFFGPCSSAAVVCAMLEFFEGTDSSLLNPILLDLFERNTSSPWGGDIAETLMNMAIPSQEEMLRLFGVIRQQTHPSFQIIDDAQSLDLLSQSYKDEASHVASPEFAFVHAAAALGYLLSTEHHAKFGCRWTMSKAAEHYRTCVGTISRCGRHTALCLVVCTYLTFYVCCSFQLSEAYVILGCARSLIVRQGLLNVTTEDQSGIQTDVRLPLKQIITTLELIDCLVSTTLGLPRAMLSTTPGLLETILQDDSSVDPRLYTAYRVTTSTAALMSDMCAMIVNTDQGPEEKKQVDPAILEKADQELAACAQMLDQSATSQSRNTPIRAPKHGLMTTFWWAELTIYSPFLNYLQPLAEGQPVPPNFSEPALRCLKTATNTINACEGMLRSRADSLNYLRIMCPTNVSTVIALFMSTLTLIFLICVHKVTKPPGEAWRRAEMGIRLLEALRCDSGGAGQCIAIIREVVRQLNHFVHFDFDHIERTTQKLCFADDERRRSQTQFTYADSLPALSSGGYPHAGPSYMSTSADEILAYARHLDPADEEMESVPE